MFNAVVTCQPVCLERFRRVPGTGNASTGSTGLLEAPSLSSQAAVSVPRRASEARRKMCVQEASLVCQGVSSSCDRNVSGQFFGTDIEILNDRFTGKKNEINMESSKLEYISWVTVKSKKKMEQNERTGV
ncbi:uncharacterized protein LJ264_016328 [Porphyrio hochstetteri]